MEKKYISIKEACQVFNKSLSTIRRTIKDTPANKLKHEELPTGHKKIFINVEYLREYFNEDIKQSNYLESGQNNASNELLNESLTVKLESKENELKSLQNIITVLNNELEVKNKQLAEKDKQIESLIERQRESNIIVSSSLNQLKQLETESQNNKKRWWQK